ncbi:MAG: FISUMP domain-containing protein [Candidatus Falkowbacteria bacterium]
MSKYNQNPTLILKFFTFFILIIFSLAFLAHRSEAAVFSHNQSQGSRDTEVKALQQYLNTHGYPVARTGAGSKGQETAVFGPATKQALIHFQKDNHITPANGYFGPATRKVMATVRSAAGTTPTPKNTPTTSLPKPNSSTPSVIIESPKSTTTEIIPIPTYTIGGTIMGLTGQMTLRNNTTDQLMLTPNSARLFTFTTSLPTGTNYYVTATPGSITEHCYLINNSGMVVSTNITTIQIACSTTLAESTPINPFTNPIIPSSAPTIHELSYTTDGNGIITGSSTQSITLNTNGTEVTATPNISYHFITWNDGLTNQTRTDSNIRSNQTYTASFTINNYTITYTAGANGTLSGVTTQTVAYGSTGTEVVAIPDANYHFVSWSDGVLTATRTDSNVTSSLAVTASFADCGEIVTDARDGNTYPTVKIGTQCWTQKNMAYLSSVVPSAIGSTAVPYYYVPQYQGVDVTEAKATINYPIYGVLYNHPAALTACPTGWHLPSDAEYTTLTSFLGGEAVAGNKLKSSSSWDGTNTVGFNALPAGNRDTNTAFYFGSDTVLWSDLISGQTAWNRFLQVTASNALRFADNRGLGGSVRCLKN